MVSRAQPPQPFRPSVRSAPRQTRVFARGRMGMFPADPGGYGLAFTVWVVIVIILLIWRT